MQYRDTPHVWSAGADELARVCFLLKRTATKQGQAAALLEFIYVFMSTWNIMGRPYPSFVSCSKKQAQGRHHLMLYF